MEKKVIRKIQISYDNQSFRDISLINAELKEFDHAFSNPWEISVDIQFVKNGKLDLFMLGFLCSSLTFY